MHRTTTQAVLRVLACLAACLILAPTARAQGEVSVVAELSNTSVYLGDSVLLQITVEGTDDADEPSVPEIPGVSVLAQGGGSQSRSFITWRNGRREATQRLSYVFQYSLTPTRAGVFDIPAIDVPVAGRTYTTQPLRVSAVEPPIDPDALIRIELDAEEAYVGQPVRARVSWFFEGVARSASFRASELPPSIDVMPLPPPAGTTSDVYRIDAFGVQAQAAQARGVRDSRPSPALVFELMLIPREAGEFRVGPVVVVFDRSRGPRRVMSRSDEVTLSVRPLPEAGRPPGFTGLIGDFSLSLDASPTEVNVGDPISLRLTIHGPEPLSGADAPDLAADPDIAERFKPSADGWERTGQDRAGARSFETTIRARTEDVDAIPPIRLPYFDPVSGEYRYAMTDEVPLEVRRTRRVTAADAIMAPGRAAPPSSRRLKRAGDGVWALQTDPARLLASDGIDPLAWGASPVVVTVLVAPPAAYALATIVVLARRRSDPEARRRRRAVARGMGLVARGRASEGIRSWASGVTGMSEQAVTAADVRALGADGDEDAKRLADALLTGERSRYGEGEAENGAAEATDLRAAMNRLRTRTRAKGVSA